MNARAISLMVLVKRLGNLHGEDFFATRDAIQAGIESLEEDLIEAEKVGSYAVTTADALKAVLNEWVNGRKVADGISLTVRQQADAALSKNTARKHQNGCDYEQGAPCICDVGPDKKSPPGVGSSGAEAIAAERARQRTQEGWSPSHDDEHAGGELSLAAACYAMTPEGEGAPMPPLWPWDASWWKPKDERRNLVRAGALIAAEIDRLDRAARIAHATSTPSQGIPR